MGKRIMRALSWVLVGTIGSGLIFAAALAVTEAMVPVKLRLLSVTTSMWNDYAFAQGTWTMDNDKPAFPLQTTQITCRRYNMTCVSAQAEVSFGDTLNAELTEYEVTRWDNDVIIFKNTGLCVDYTYTITRANERVIGTRTTKKTNAEGCLVNLSSKTINLTLTDGFKVYWHLVEEARAKVFPFAWIGLALLWVFIVFRIWKGWRASGPRLQESLVSPGMA